ncbi:MAG: hypothetical protein GC150_16270 [Rhizobiales bacterium]|nr:hypothetical protein [Hyphomicrobiales bacterium]
MPRHEPFVLVEEIAGVTVVDAVNRRALAAGVRPGMRLVDARAFLVNLRSAAVTREIDDADLRRLAHWCGRYGARVGIDGPADIWVDVSGTAHLFGGERHLLTDLVTRLARSGLGVRTGLADTYGAAHALARHAPSLRSWSASRPPARRPASHAGGPTGHHPHEDEPPPLDLPHPGIAIATAGRTREAVADLPVAALRLTDETRQLLSRLGLRRIAQLCAIERQALRRRFPSRQVGEAVVHRLSQIVGDATERPRPLLSEPRHGVRRVFAEPLVSHEGIVTCLELMSRDLADLLERSGNGALELVVTFFRSDQTAEDVRVGFAAPSCDAGHFLSLLRERITGLDAGYGIDAIRCLATTTDRLTPRTTELGAATACSSSKDVSALLDRIANRIGRQAVLRHELRDTHIPEKAEHRMAVLTSNHHFSSPGGSPRRSPARLSPLSEASSSPVRSNVSRPILLLPRPEPIEVIAAVPDGPPQHFRWRRLAHRIRRVEGPERIAPEWWNRNEKESSRTRDYYVIEDDRGRRYWVFRNGLYEGEPDGPVTFAPSPPLPCDTRPGSGPPAADAASSRARADDAAPAWFIHGFFA